MERDEQPGETKACAASAPEPAAVSLTAQWMQRAAVIIFCAAIVSLRSAIPELAAFALMGILLLAGAWILVEKDASARRGLGAHALRLQLIALVLGALSGIVLSLPQKSSIHWMQPLSLFAIQMQIFFFLFNLSIVKKPAEQRMGTIGLILCLTGHQLATPESLLYVGSGPRFDAFGLVIIGSGLLGQSIATLITERDEIELSWHFVAAWAGVSAGVLALWWMIVAQ